MSGAKPKKYQKSRSKDYFTYLQEMLRTPKLPDETLMAHPDCFAVNAKNDVSVNSTIQLCTKHATKDGCHYPKCDALHLCKFFMLGSSCRFGNLCQYGHTIESHNLHCLHQHNLDGLNIQQIRTLLKQTDQSSSFPNICKFYNTANGCKWPDGKGCPAMHICLHYVKGDCFMGHKRCKWLHDILAPQPIYLLQKHGVNVACSPKVILEQLKGSLQDTDVKSGLLSTQMSAISSSGDQMISRGLSALSFSDQLQHAPSSNQLGSQSLSARSRTTSETTDDGHDLFICMFYLRGACLFKQKCINLHVKMPYQWQYKSDARWNNFDDPCNNEIEFNYRAPENARCLSTFSNLDSSSPFKIDFETMLVDWTPFGQAEVRRMSTISSVKASTGQTLATRWLWYWKDDGDVWRKYGEGSHNTTVTVEQLEMEYLQNPEGTISFTTQYNRYIISFKKMTQKNKKFGTKRQLLRRSAAPIEVLPEDIKVAAATGGRTMGKAPVKLNVPPHWDMNAPSTDPYFQLVKIDKSGGNAAEYLKVEKRFQETLVPPHVSIISIERIQNLELWEGFKRKRYWMKEKRPGKADPEEKLLFHGAKEEYLDGICRQGLDWRLSGKSVGTLYGKGSYFARDASYSKCYAQTKMLLVRVIIGDYVVGKKEYTRPPPKSSGLEMYDSCVDQVGGPKIYVVFDHQQSYPEYVITFKEKMYMY